MPRSVGPGSRGANPKTIPLIEDYLDLAEQGMPLRDIASRLGKTPDAVIQMCKRHSLPIRKAEELQHYRERRAISRENR